MKKFRQLLKNTTKSPRSKTMKSKTTAPSGDRRKVEDLGGRYGKIGIPAVAAALPYQSDAKNSAYAPVVHREEEWRDEMTAV
jgi:hypothetical protein